MLKFHYLDKGLGIVFPAYFVYDVLIKMFFAWLLLLFEILGNMCIATVYYPGCDVMDFEINVIFLIKPFFLHDQKVKIKT